MTQSTKHYTTTQMAVTRTRLAHERTLMAWVRTAFSMISFGFTIIKFFQYLADSLAVESRLSGNGPRNLGITLILLGTVSLMVATYRYGYYLKRLRHEGRKSLGSLAFIVALAVTFIGIVAAISVVHPLIY